ncbi:UPF0606 protein KIAA1549L isoform X2 [Esox lucius]|uniref:UPF0606 protein KIAA1549L isoform X2 n=1 Tax=Esox lucius TaxID=8010 RepID=UPI001476A5E0|nr:UPF0606 protein KIAA1549L isoform X2 [Esox lucius]
MPTINSPMYFPISSNTLPALSDPDSTHLVAQRTGSYRNTGIPQSSSYPSDLVTETVHTSLSVPDPNRNNREGESSGKEGSFDSTAETKNQAFSGSLLSSISGILNDTPPSSVAFEEAQWTPLSLWNSSLSPVSGLKPRPVTDPLALSQNLKPVLTSVTQYVSPSTAPDDPRFTLSTILITQYPYFNPAVSSQRTDEADTESPAGVPQSVVTAEPVLTPLNLASHIEETTIMREELLSKMSESRPILTEYATQNRFPYAKMSPPALPKYLKTVTPDIGRPSTDSLEPNGHRAHLSPGSSNPADTPLSSVMPSWSRQTFEGNTSVTYSEAPPKPKSLKSDSLKASVSPPPLLDGANPALEEYMSLRNAADDTVTISPITSLSSTHNNRYPASEQNVGVSKTESVTVSEPDVLITPVPHKHVTMDTAHTEFTIRAVSPLDLSSLPSSLRSSSSSPHSSSAVASSVISNLSESSWVYSPSTTASLSSLSRERPHSTSSSTDRPHSTSFSSSGLSLSMVLPATLSSSPLPSSVFLSTGMMSLPPGVTSPDLTSSSAVRLSAGMTSSSSVLMSEGVTSSFVTPASSVTPSVPFPLPEEVSGTSALVTEIAMEELTAGTSREKTSSFQTGNLTGPALPTSQGTSQEDTTVSLQLTTVTTTTVSATAAATRPTITTASTATTPPATTGNPAATITRRTTTTTTTAAPVARRTLSPPTPPRGSTYSLFTPFPFTTTTEAPPRQCNVTEKMWVKSILTIHVRRNRLDSIQRQNLRRGLSQALKRALNDTTAQAQVETVFGSPNVTVGYHVTGVDIVYPPSVVVKALHSYGWDRLMSDVRQFVPMVTALPNTAAPWRPSPAIGHQLKTVLRFVGPGDDPQSCRFSQMMEQRLENVFSETQAKDPDVRTRLSVQMLSVSQSVGSPAVSLVYTVRNGSANLNGTTASNLLNQLTAELVGYFLFYPPLVIAEPLEYHNLNTSIATRDFWVITVILDVDNSSLEGQYQSFASIMEHRLAGLFVVAGRQGTRFRRATTVDNYTVQMVSIRRVTGQKNPAEMTYYVQLNGQPLPGTSAAKVLNTVDSQTMALTLGYFVQLQAEPVVKNPPNNLWIIAAVLAPIAVVTLIIIIITTVLCRKNKSDFKADAMGNLNPRVKTAYRRDVTGYYHQPVQGFDYAKQHLGRVPGGEEDTLPVTQDTLVLPLPVRDAPLSLSLEKALQQDGTANKKTLCSDIRKRLPSEDSSVISNESGKLNSNRGSAPQKVTAQQKPTKEETRQRNDLYDTSSGSLQLISIKPMTAPPTYSHPASSERSQDSAILNGNGEVNLALKQKSDIEHYRNKLRLKARRKGYYDFPSDGSGSTSRVLAQRHGHQRALGEHGRPLEPDEDHASTFVKSRVRPSQVRHPTYRSRQSLNSPSPGGTEMDLLVMRERPRRGIRNSGYDTEPELIEETNVDRLIGPRGGYVYPRGVKGHSETSTLSSQPSIDEVRQQMHLLLEEAFSLASGGHSMAGRHHHSHHGHHHGHYSPGPPPLPYSDAVTSAPGTVNRVRGGGLQWVPAYRADMYQCSLPKPAFRFTQLPDMAMGSPPPPIPPRAGPPPGTSLRRSSSDLGPKARTTESSGTNMADMQTQHNDSSYAPLSRAALPSVTTEQPVSTYSGNPITAVYAIPASRSGYSEYFVSTPPSSYRSPSWMSYPPEPEDVPPQWAESVALPGYVEAFPHPRYPQSSPPRLPLHYGQAAEPLPTPATTASQQSLPDVGESRDSIPLSSLSTSALVQAIRQEVAKLAKKQTDMFEFQV